MLPDDIQKLFNRPWLYRIDAEHRVAPVESLAELRAVQARVRSTYVTRWWGVVWVSTMFLGMDMALTFQGPPRVFETMAFSHDDVLARDRYATWDEAVAGHWFIVYQVETHRGTWAEALNYWCPDVVADFRDHMARFTIPAID